VAVLLVRIPGVERCQWVVKCKRCLVFGGEKKGERESESGVGPQSWWQ